MTADQNITGNMHEFGTLAVHAGAEPDKSTGAVIEPISLSSTFSQTSPGQPIGAYEYSRSSNPNRDAFERAVASLEKGKHALAFSSGSAATSTIIQSLAQGSHIISFADVYGGTHRYFTKVANTHGVDVTFLSNIEEKLEESIIPNRTKLVWVETPSNPTLKLTDIEKITTTAHKHNLIVVVDNTFLSPYIQNPIKFGADIVVHSVTKFINGHSDVVMGVAITSDDAIHSRLSFLQNAIGAVPSAFDSWLAHRGLKTIHLRVRQSSISALAIAKVLQSSPHVIAVNYPGLESHPKHSLIHKQHRDSLGGGIISFRVVGGAKGAATFCENTSLFTLAESLGGIESLCEVPAVMTHGGIPVESREEVGVYDDLIRLSVGIEDTADLIKDVENALLSAANSVKLANGKN